MEDYGLAVTDPAWQFFPFAVEIPTASGWAWHMAAFFYESVWCFAIFLVLWLCRHRLAQAGRGASFLLYLLLYGAERAVVEGLRTDSLMVPGMDLRVSQLLSIALALGAAAALAARWWTNRAQRRILVGNHDGEAETACRKPTKTVT